VRVRRADRQRNGGSYFACGGRGDSSTRAIRKMRVVNSRSFAAVRQRRERKARGGAERHLLARAAEAEIVYAAANAARFGKRLRVPVTLPALLLCQPPHVILEPPAFRGPVHEVLQFRAVFPGQAEKFSRRQLLRFAAQKSFKAPAQIRALPWIQTISTRNNPVVTQRVPHTPRPTNDRTAPPASLAIPFRFFLQTNATAKSNSPPSRFMLRNNLSQRRGQVLVNDYPRIAAPFPNSGVPQICFKTFTVFCFFG